MVERLRVLVTGVGAPGTRGTLHALRHNPDRVPVTVIGTDARAAAVGRHWVGHFERLPLPAEPDYADRLLDLCRRTAVDLVIPQTTRETEALSGLRESFLAEGVRIMVAGGAAVRRANDKGALLATFARLGLPHPVWHTVHDEAALRAAAAELGYPARPVAVKPPVSNGMRGFRVLRERAWDVARFLGEKPNGIDLDLDGLAAILGRGGPFPELLVSEFLPGPEYSVDAFRGRRGEIALPRLRRAVVGGISADTVLEDRPEMARATLDAAAELGLEYVFGFQFKLDAAGVPKLLECNPRVQGTMVASLFGGVNVIWLGVREALGEAPDVPERSVPGAAFQRFWGGIGTTTEGVSHEI